MAFTLDDIQKEILRIDPNKANSIQKANQKWGGLRTVPSLASETQTNTSNNVNVASTSEPTSTASYSAPVATETENPIKHSIEAYTPSKSAYSDKLDKWLDTDYKMSKDEEKEAKQIVKDYYKENPMANTNNPNASAAFYNSLSDGQKEELNKISALNNKVSNTASFLGGVMNAVPFLRNVEDKLMDNLNVDESASFKNQFANQRKQNPLAFTAGEFASKGTQYGALNNALGEGANFAQRLALGQGADTLLDTIPEFVSNTLDGKYDNADGSYDTKNALLDIAKNQGVNLAFNLGAEGVAGLIKGVKALKGVNSEIDNAFKDFTIDQIKPTDSLADEARAIAKNERSNDLNYLMKQFNEKGHLLPGDSIADEAKALRQSAESNDLTSLMKQFNDTYGNDAAENVVKQAAQTTPEIPKLSDTEIDEILENPVIKEALEKTEGVQAVADAVKNVADNTNAKTIAETVAPKPAKTVADTTKVLGSNSEAVDYAKNAQSNINGNGKVRESAYAGGLDRTDLPDDIKNAFINEPLLYNQLSNKETLSKAQGVLSNTDNTSVFQQYRDMLTTRDPAAIPVGYDLAKRYLDNGDTEMAISVVEDMSKALTSSGQFSQAAAITMLKSDPMASLRMLNRDISRINKSGAEQFGKKWKDFSLTEDEIKAFGEIKKGDTEAIQNLYEQVTKRLADNYPSTNWEKIVEATKTSMMLNPRTHIRNVAANTVMLPVRSLTDRVSALGQNAVHLFNPDFKVTQSVVGGSIEQKKIANQIFDEQIKPLLEGVSKWENVSNNAEHGKQVFKDSLVGKAGKKATMGVSNALNTLTNGKLQNFVDNLDESMTGSVMENLRRFDYHLLGAVEDDPFVKKNFSNRLASYMRAQKIKSIDAVPDDAIQTAYQEALKATFKDDNYLTKMFTGIKNSTGKFGEVLLPFVKTPANLAKRGIEYSPVGFIDTIKNADGKNAAQIVDDISKNLVGTAGIYGGYLLAKNGLIQGALSDDTDMQNFEKQQGKQAFSIKVGNEYYTFDWAQPAAIPIIIGATINDAIKESDEEEANYLDLAKQSGVAAANAWLELSPLQSMSDIFDTSNGKTIPENIIDEVTEFPQRLIPSVLGATARTMDPVMRETNVKGDPKQTWLNTAQSKIPGLSDDLPAKRDTWGNERLRQDNTKSAAIANFLNPGTLGYNSSTPIDGEIERLYNDTKNKAVFPNTAKWSVQISKTNPDTGKTETSRRKLTNEEHSEYQRLMGEKSYELAEAFINSDTYSKLDDATKAKALGDIYSLAKELAENTMFQSEINSNLYKSYLYGKTNGVIDKIAKDAVYKKYDVNAGKTIDNVYQQGGEAGVENYLNKKNTIEKNGLSFDDKNTYAYDNYGNVGLKIAKSINDLGTSAGMQLVPVLEQRYAIDLSDEDKGNLLINYASETKLIREHKDEPAYVYALYRLANEMPDTNNDGAINTKDYRTYLPTLGYSKEEIDTIVDYIKNFR